MAIGMTTLMAIIPLFERPVGRACELVVREVAVAVIPDVVAIDDVTSGMSEAFQLSCIKGAKTDTTENSLVEVAIPVQETAVPELSLIGIPEKVNSVTEEAVTNGEIVSSDSVVVNVAGIVVGPVAVATTGRLNVAEETAREFDIPDRKHWCNVIIPPWAKERQVWYFQLSGSSRKQSKPLRKFSKKSKISYKVSDLTYVGQQPAAVSSCRRGN